LSQLLVAVEQGNAQAAAEILARRPGLAKAHGADGRTPLHVAVMGGTPLHWAYFGGSRHIIELLEQAGADPTACDEALHCTPRMFGICAPASWGFAFLVQN